MGDITTSGLITSTASGTTQFSGAIQAVGFQGLPGTASAISVGDGTVTTAILNGITGTLNVQGQYGTNGLFAGNYGLLLTNGLGSITLSNGAIIASAGVLQPINGPVNRGRPAGGAIPQCPCGP
jgi:hypothetical protein